MVWCLLKKEVKSNNCVFWGYDCESEQTPQTDVSKLRIYHRLQKSLDQNQKQEQIQGQSLRDEQKNNVKSESKNANKADSVNSISLKNEIPDESELSSTTLIILAACIGAFVIIAIVVIIVMVVVKNKSGSSRNVVIQRNVDNADSRKSI